MRQRVATALLLALPVLLALALRNPLLLFLLGLTAAFAGGREADRLLKTPYALITVLTMALFGVVGFPALSGTAVKVPAYVPPFLVALLCFGLAAAALPDRSAVGRVGRVFACLWIAPALIAIMLLHGSAKWGMGQWIVSPALLALVPVWAGDIAAIFAGKKFGKRALAPKISPKKTVEGSLANLMAAVVVAWLLGRLLHLPDARSLGAGMAVGILGQAGDLFESWLKRRAGQKDSGTLLPGHGGVLDRIDSVLFAAPVVALILLS